MSTSNNKKFLVVSIIFAIISFLMLIIVVSFTIILAEVELSDTNTITATVTYVEPYNESSVFGIIIYTEEYGSKLRIEKTEVISDVALFNDLQVGQEITVRIGIKENLDELGFVRIKTLETQGQEIITLADYNQQLETERSMVQLTGSTFAIIFFSISLSCFLVYIFTVKKQHSKQRNSQ